MFQESPANNSHHYTCEQKELDDRKHHCYIAVKGNCTFGEELKGQNSVQISISSITHVAKLKYYTIYRKSHLSSCLRSNVTSQSNYT